jgi:hypothetical protein
MEAAERAVEPAKAPPSPPDSLLGGSAAGAMTALSVVGNLLRSDYSAQLIELTKDDLLLTKAVGLALRNARPDAWVLVPSLYTETTLTEANPAVVRLAQLQQLRARLEPKASRNSKGEAGLAAKAFDDWFQKMSTSDDKGSTPLALVARQARVAELLRGGGYLLLLKVNESGGSTYTQKNFWTFLGTMPFSVSGGTVVSYTLFRGSDGALVDSHVVPISSGFARVHQVHRDARADGTSQRRR